MDAVAAKTKERRRSPAGAARETEGAQPAVSPGGAPAGVPLFLRRAPDASASPSAASGTTAEAALARSAAAILPAGVVVGRTDDPAEREAEAAADAIVRTPTTPATTHTSSSPTVLRRAPGDASSAPTPVPTPTPRPAPAASTRPAPPAPAPKSAATPAPASSPSPAPARAETPALDGEAATGIVPAEGAARLAPPDAGAPPKLEGQGPGAPLSPRVRDVLEPRFGADLGDVRVHGDKAAQDAAAALGARAFALGSEIWVGPGESDEDVELMAHEVAHVVQGGGPVVRRAPAASPPAGPPAGKGAAKAKKAKGPATGPGSTGPAAPAPAATPPAGSTPAAVEIQMPEPPTGLSREERGRVGEVRQNATQTAEAQADMPPAEEQVGDARQAVTEPTAETQARAEEGVVATLAERAPPSPEIEKLCQRIYQAIRDKRPPDEDRLVEAKPQEAAEAAGGQLNSSVQGEGERVQGSYDEMGRAPTGSPQQTPEPLEGPPAPDAPARAPASQAAPDAVPPEQVSLDADVAASHERMAEAGMDTEPARLVQDGPIAEARAAQGELGEMAQRDPQEVLAEQQAALGRASADMAALQASAYARIAAARERTATGTGAQQQQMVGSEEQQRERAGTEARRIFTDAQTQVRALLDPLPRTAMAKWDAGKTVLSTRFDQDLARVKRWIDERHSGVGGAVLGAWDALTGLPDWVVREYDRAEKAFGDGVCELIREISSDVNTVVASCEAIIDDARREIAELFASLPAELQEWAAGEQARMTEQLDALENRAHETRDNFDRDLVQRAGQAVQEARERIHALREAAGGLLGRIASALEQFLDDPAKFIIDGLLKLVGIDPGAFWSLVNRIGQVIGDIADDPMGFANNLLAGLGQGFTQFFGNFGQHLSSGFFEWLFSGLGAVGVTLPPDFSLKSIITFALQLMGITWDRVRRILARHIGERNVALLEKAYELVSTLMEKGPEGIFEMLQERLDPKQIIDQVIEAGIRYLTEALVRVVSVRLLAMLNPAGAIVQAIEAIYRVLAWVFQNAARIFSLVETVVNGAAQLVAGNISGMATAVEGALARLIAPVIDFLADYIGLGDLPEKIADVIRGFQGWIEGILDRVIGFLAERARALMASLGLSRPADQRPPAGEEGDGEVGETVRFAGGGESHRLWVKVEGTEATVMMASTPQDVREFLKAPHVKSKDNPPEIKALVREATTLANSTTLDATRLARAFAAQQRSGPQTAGARSANASADEKVENEEQRLARLIGEILEGLGGKLARRFAPELSRVHSSAGGDLTAGIEKLGERHPRTRYETFKDALDAMVAEAVLGRAVATLERPANLESAFGRWANKSQLLPALEEARQALTPPARNAAPDPNYPPIPGLISSRKASDRTRWMADNVKDEINQDRTGDFRARKALLDEIIDRSKEGAAPPVLKGAMEWAIRKARADVDPRLKSAIKGSRNAIITFLEEMTLSGSSGGLSLPDFYSIWQAPVNADWVKNRFRDASPEMHEWIPSELIYTVLEHAHAEAIALGAKKRNAVKWIQAHHKLRTPTEHIVFTPQRGTAGAIELAGHSGALYILVKRSDPKPATAGQNHFHQVLANAVAGMLNASMTPVQLVTRLKSVALSLVWDGTLRSTELEGAFDFCYVPGRRGDLAFTTDEKVPRPMSFTPQGELRTGTRDLAAISNTAAGRQVDRVTSMGERLGEDACGITLREMATLARERRNEIREMFDNVIAELSR
ncbi:MAG TPA: DUF4157 domain-containing protein [Longimicrobium sp.]|nr:DUF4157 domain-containing protein [Longimicrobium sp.]